MITYYWMIFCGVMKHHTGLTDRTGRKLPHRRLKPSHQPQCQPNKTVGCFPTTILSYFSDRKLKFKRKVCLHNCWRKNVYTIFLPHRR